MLIWAHQEVMRRMKEDKKYSSYAELHRLFEERYNLNTTCNGLRRAMVRMFDYDWQEFSRARSSKKLIFQMRQFMIRYAGMIQYTIYYIYRNIITAAKLRHSVKLVYMDETWIARYHR